MACVMGLADEAAAKSAVSYRGRIFSSFLR